MAQVHALQGDRAAAERELVQLLPSFYAGCLSPYQIAMVQTRLGQPAEALR